MNLYKETVSALKDYGRKIDEIKFCEHDDCYFTLKDFKELADLDYDNSSGQQLILKDLRLYGPDFYLERYEFDGEEGWSLEQVLERPVEYKRPDKLINL